MIPSLPMTLKPEGRPRMSRVPSGVEMYPPLKSGPTGYVRRWLPARSALTSAPGWFCPGQDWLGGEKRPGVSSSSAPPSGRVKRGRPSTANSVCAPVCRSTMMAVGSLPYSMWNRALLPSPDQSTSLGTAISPGGLKVVIAYRPPAGSTRYSVVVAVASVGSPGAGGPPVTGLQVASNQPGPTWYQGTDPIGSSTPCAAGCAGGGVGWLDAPCPAVESVDEEHPATNTAASAAITVVLCFIYVLLRVRGCLPQSSR